MTETKFYMVKGNLKPSIQAALKWKDGSVVDLTGCTGVKFHMKQGSSVLIDKDVASLILLPAASCSFTGLAETQTTKVCVTRSLRSPSETGNHVHGRQKPS